VPTFGICLGHPVARLATGARTVKMSSVTTERTTPVIDLDTGRVFISSQNTEFAVDEATLRRTCGPRTARCSEARCRASRSPTGRRFQLPGTPRGESRSTRS